MQASIEEGEAMGLFVRRGDRGRDARGQQRRQGRRRARHRCRTETGHAVLRQAARDLRHGAAAVEHIDALDPVDVNVDETGNNDVAGAVDSGRAGGTVDDAGFDGLDAAVADDERASLDHAARKSFAFVFHEVQVVR